MTSFSRLNANGTLHLLHDAPKAELRGRIGHFKVPDEIVLAMRRMHEIDRKPHTQVMAAYPEYSKHYVRDVLNYTLRAHLRVTK